MLRRDSGERIGIEVVQPTDRSAAAAVGSRQGRAVGADRDPVVDVAVGARTAPAAAPAADARARASPPRRGNA